MTKSKLIEKLTNQLTHMPVRIIEESVKKILDQMTITLINGGRIEIRGFGSFSIHYHAPRVGRNPKTGDIVNLEGKYVPHFKPGKELRNRINAHA